MTEESEIEDDGEAVFTMDEPTELTLHDGECWVYDPDLLDPATEYEGVLAVQFRDGALWWLSGETRKWVNVEDAGKVTGKPPTKIRSVQ